MQVDNGILAKQRWEEPSFVGSEKTPYIAFVSSFRNGYFLEYLEYGASLIGVEKFNPSMYQSFFINKYQTGESLGLNAPQNYTPTRFKLGEAQALTKYPPQPGEIIDFENLTNESEGFLFIWSSDVNDQDIVKNFSSQINQLVNWPTVTIGGGVLGEYAGFISSTPFKWTVFVINDNQPNPTDKITLTGSFGPGAIIGYFYYGFVEDLGNLQDGAANNSILHVVSNAEGKVIFKYYPFTVSESRSDALSRINFILSEDQSMGLNFPDE